MTLYKNRYRVDTTRAPEWDYGDAGFYFVTICTAGRSPFFGVVVNDQMALSSVGQIARDEWLKTAQIRQNVSLDAFVIMPDHIHGIVEIRAESVETRRGASLHGASLHGASLHGASLHGASLPPPLRKFGPLAAGSLSALVNGYKGAVTRWCRKNGFGEFTWQSRFWDRIIRNERELDAVRTYIANNPCRWAIDRDNETGSWG